MRGTEGMFWCHNCYTMWGALKELSVHMVIMCKVYWRENFKLCYVRGTEGILINYSYLHWGLLRVVVTVDPALGALGGQGGLGDPSWGDPRVGPHGDPGTGGGYSLAYLRGRWRVACHPAECPVHRCGESASLRPCHLVTENILLY